MWLSNDHVRDWFASILKRPPDLSEQSIAEFQRIMNEIRYALQEVHFQRAPQLGYIQNRVGSISMGFQSPLGELPLFRALPAQTNNKDEALFIAVAETVLMQFCSYLGEVLAGRSLDLYRCEGLFRDPKMKSISPAPGVVVEKEMEWRCEIPFLGDLSNDPTSELHRCADFFLGGKGKFCSDACRFATFQIVKQLKDPAYLSEKQKRYRARKDSK